MEWCFLVAEARLADVRVGASGRGGLGLRLTPISVGSPAEELDIVGDDLGHAALLAFLVLIGAVLQPPFDVEGIAFFDLRGRGLGELIPADDRVELGFFRAVDGAVGGEPDARDGFAGLRVVKLGVAGGVAD